MDLPRTAGLLRRLEVPDSTGSTNADLVVAATADPAAWPAPAAIITDHQTAGRGRLGRAWQAAKGHSLAISVLLRPTAPRERWAWLSLAAGAAMTAGLRSAGVEASAKWPNDVLIGGRKVAGVLAEVLPDGSGVVIGAGLNHAAPDGALPVPSATSLAAEGGPTDPDTLISAYLSRLLGLADQLDRGDDVALREAALAVSGTVGRAVRVALPDGSAVTGEALDIDGAGRIVVDAGPIRGTAAIAAGDVEHLRYE